MSFIMFLNIRMAMTSEIQSQLSKRNAVTLSGNLAVDGHDGGGAATAVFRHQLSEVSSIEFVGSAGLRALVGVQTSRWVICFLQINLNSALLSVLAVLYMFLVRHIPVIYHYTQLQQWA